MMEELVAFLKKYDIYDEEVFNSFINDSFKFESESDYKYSECLYVVDENDILVKIRALIPKIVDYKTILINIHEYVHYYTFYKKLGEKIEIGIDCEVLPMLYERLFVIEKDDVDLYNHWNKIKDGVLENNNSPYVYALKIQDSLLDLFYKSGKVKRLKKEENLLTI